MAAESQTKLFEHVTLLALMFMVFFYAASDTYVNDLSQVPTGELLLTAIGVLDDPKDLWTPFDVIIGLIGVWISWRGYRNDYDQDLLIVFLRSAIAAAGLTILVLFARQILAVVTREGALGLRDFSGSHFPLFLVLWIGAAIFYYWKRVPSNRKEQSAHPDAHATVERAETATHMRHAAATEPRQKERKPSSSKQPDETDRAAATGIRQKERKPASAEQPDEPVDKA